LGAAAATYDVVQGYANEIWRGSQSVPWLSVSDGAQKGITATALINRAHKFSEYKVASLWFRNRLLCFPGNTTYELQAMGRPMFRALLVWKYAVLFM
jgi:hypothetical protein